MYDAILSPVPAADADGVVARMASLAVDQDATLHVLHVVEAGSAAGIAPHAVVQSTDGTAEAVVEAAAETARDHGVDAVETAVRTGDPAEEILAYASDREVDLVTLGTHGRTGLARRMLGSVTERVVRRAPVPVHVVRLS